MLRLTTLGAVDLRDRLGHPVRDVLAQPKRVALLVFLALESRRGPVPRDRLLALFWPESDAEHARNALSQGLHHLRQALGADSVENVGTNNLQVPATSLWCDAVAFAEAIERGEGELAMDLYRGEFCPSLFVGGAPEAERWIEDQRSRLRAQAGAASRVLTERLLARGDHNAAARLARRALAMHPDDEGEVRALLAVLDRAGDGAGALIAYREYTQRLAAELEAEPAPETQRLVEAIRKRREAATLAPGQETTADAPAVSPSPAAPAAPASRRRPRMLALAALAVALLATATSLYRRGGATPAPSVRAVAVFPFTVRGERLGFLKEGMADLLSAKLNGTSGFRAIDPRAVIAATARDSTGTADGSALPAIAQRLGAGRYITGEVVEIAGRVQVNGALFDATGGSQPVATATVSGDTTRLFELVDELTGRMMAELIQGRDTALTRLAALTTTSLPALRAYLEGERALRAGLDLQAADAFREATMLDTTFALAQYRLAMAATWVSVRGIESNDAISALATRAARRAERLTPLVRDLLTAYSAYKAPRAGDAERIYRRLTEAYPDNVEAWFMLGEVWFHYNPMLGRSPLPSVAAFERVLALDPDNSHAQLHLARMAAREGRSATLDSLTRVYLARHHDAARTLEVRALQAAVRGDPAGYDRVARDILGADDLVLASILQSVAFYAQNPEMVRAITVPYLRSATNPTTRRLAPRTLADLPIAMGRWTREEALPGIETDQAWRLESAALLAASPFVPVSRTRLAALRDTIASRRPYSALGHSDGAQDEVSRAAMQAYLVGLLSIRLQDSARTRHSLDTLEGMARAGSRIARELSPSLWAEQLRTSGDATRALATLQRRDWREIRNLYDFHHWGVHERFLLADLLATLGRTDEALAVYQSFPAGYDLPWVAFAHLRQAQIHEQAGRAERARFHYSRALRFWQSADPECAPLVAQARDGLARVSAAAE